MPEHRRRTRRPPSVRRRTPPSSPPDRPARNRHRCAAGPSQRSGPSVPPRRSPQALRRRTPARARDHAAMGQTPRAAAAAAPARSPSRSSVRRHSRARRAGARRSASMCAAASPAGPYSSSRIRSIIPTNGSSFGTRRLPVAPVTRWHRERQHLRHRPRVDAKTTPYEYMAKGSCGAAPRRTGREGLLRTVVLLRARFHKAPCAASNRLAGLLVNCLFYAG